MEESKSAEQALLKDLAGITVGDYDGEIDSILEYSYAFGLHYGKYYVHRWPFFSSLGNLFGNCWLERIRLNFIKLHHPSIYARQSRFSSF